MWIASTLRELNNTPSGDNDINPPSGGYDIIIQGT